jgi:hypothetical protein
MKFQFAQNFITKESIVIIYKRLKFSGARCLCVCACVFVMHKKPKVKSVEHPGDILYSEIHTRNVEIPNVPIV